MPDFLICYHVAANAGYAIEPLEILFHEVGSEIAGGREKVHLGYRHYDRGMPRWVDWQSDNFITLDYQRTTPDQLAELEQYISDHSIEQVLAFDLPVGARIIGALRRGGVKTIISYYGAPMSRVNKGLKLLAKRIEVMLTGSKPDYFIFESQGMRRSATHGRGISAHHTSVVPLGIDASRFSRAYEGSRAHDAFGIPAERRIIFYAGHMEKRKGVDVIIKAAAGIINERGHGGLHFLICDNKEGEAAVFDELYKGTKAEQHITFGGYRDDIPELMADCYVAVIASTGWDSFPRASLEMAAAGLPLLVSNLPGLNETIEEGKTGFLFRPGDHRDLADKLLHLSKHPELRKTLGMNAARRIRERYTLDIQKHRLEQAIRHATGL